MRKPGTVRNELEDSIITAACTFIMVALVLALFVVYLVKPQPAPEPTSSTPSTYVWCSESPSASVAPCPAE